MTDEARKTLIQETEKQLNAQCDHYDELLAKKNALVEELERIEIEMASTQDVVDGLRELWRSLDNLANFNK